MLNEIASSREDRPVARVIQAPISKAELLQNELRQQVATVMDIQHEQFTEPSPQDEEQPVEPGLGLQSHLVASFEGRLLEDAETAYEMLDQQLANLNHMAVMRATQAAADTPFSERPHTIHIITGRVNPQPRPWWPNLLLFIATLFSVLLVGTQLALDSISMTNPVLANQLASRGLTELWRGLPYAVSLLLILGAHEMGHYFAARYHNLAVTLPYFIPMPIPGLSMLGTMGAFIQLRQPMRNRKVLFDVGAAGPLAGLIFAVPILFIGLSQTMVSVPPPGAVYTFEGDSLLYALAKIAIKGQYLPSGGYDVMITSSQLAWAGWTGLLVTALNLIPIGQLDGGHVMYALLGERARKLYYPLLIALGLLALLSNFWLLWVVLLLFFGRIYATPLDMITPLDRRRQILAVITLVIFVLVFVPAPLTEHIADTIPLAPRNSAQLLPMLMPGLAVVLLKWRRR
ncbi:MAG: site-2 protease family protein [Chloroflexi bacterium]|nr:site-2 protease family protein [Chloroflexota bacterium]MCC6894035.1 site-2 protease family protein [Anaerolineae bacterium]